MISGRRPPPDDPLSTDVPSLLSSQSSSGDVISRRGFNASTWYDADTSPHGGGTVMAALLAAGEYGGADSIFVGRRLAEVRSAT